jgi:hypothetical protein
VLSTALIAASASEQAHLLYSTIGTTWNAVIIEWDDGLTASIEHNDMARVEQVTTN